MLKVLIADDEKNICLMIQKLICWENYGMEVIGLAHNGFDTVQMIETMHPDVVITDIRMPGYDGLEIIARGREIQPDIHFIIISGYKYFEYAHKALNLGVEHYLLKPIDKQELEETLDRIIQKRNEKLSRAEETAQLKERVQYSRRKAQKHFLSSIMEKDGTLPELGLNQINNEYQCQFEQGCFVAILAKLDCEDDHQDMTALLHMMESIIDRDLAQGDKEYIDSIMKSGVMSIINYRTEIREETRASFEKPFHQMRRELDKFSGYHLTVGIGGEKNSISEISESIKEAIYAVKCRGKIGVDRVIYYERLRYKAVPVNQIVSEKNGREMDNMIEAMDYEALCDAIISGVDNICSTAFFSPASVYEYLDTVTGKIVSVLKSNQVRKEQIQEFDEKTQYILDHYYDIKSMVYYYSQNVRDCFKQLIAEKKNKSQLPIRLARQYVQENYSRQISLEDVAETINMSPSYLSTMFKKEMGINFSDFLISCRMEAAKDLLKTTSLPIAEVAERVGYTDSRYFSRIFLKVVGLKPSVYRRLYL